MTRFLHQLRQYDRTRGLSDASRLRERRYRLDQAVWASRAEVLAESPLGPEVDPGISFVILPWRDIRAPAEAREASLSAPEGR